MVEDPFRVEAVKKFRGLRGSVELVLSDLSSTFCWRPCSSSLRFEALVCPSIVDAAHRDESGRKIATIVKTFESKFGKSMA